MGLWSDLFRRASRDESAVFSAGRRYAPEGAPPFPDVGETRLVDTGDIVRHESFIGAGKPALVELYSNCCCGDNASRNMESLAKLKGDRVSFVSICVNGLVAFPPRSHPEHGRRGKEWPRMMAAELDDRVGGMEHVSHLVVDVTDDGSLLVDKLGLCTVPTHVLVDSSGKVLCTHGRGQLPSATTVEWLVEFGA